MKIANPWSGIRLSRYYARLLKVGYVEDREPQVNRAGKKL